jgi:hypothetical protein
MRRTCTNTGPGLVNTPVSGMRIANPAYGPTAPPERTDGGRASRTRLGHMPPGHLPAAWRDGHLLHTIDVPPDAG